LLRFASHHTWSPIDKLPCDGAGLTSPPLPGAGAGVASPPCTGLEPCPFKGMKPVSKVVMLAPLISTNTSTGPSESTSSEPIFATSFSYPAGTSKLTT